MKLFAFSLTCATLLALPHHAAQPGSVDPSFDPGSGADDLVKRVVGLGNGKVLVAGYFNNINGVARRGIARLESTGAVDTTFNPGQGADNGISALIVQPDGKIVVGGEFTHFDGVARNRIARLNENGSLDPSFDPGSGLDGTRTPVVLGLELQNDSRILVAGSFTTVAGTERHHLARLETTGKLDASFDPKFEEGSGKWVFNVKVQNDGQIIAAGVFTKINGVIRSGIARFSGSGVLDTSFDAKFDEFSAVAALDLLGNERIVIGGLFVNAVTGEFASVAALNSDGSYVPGFRRETPPDEQVNSVAVQGNGKILLGGYFKTIAGVARNGIARLNSDGGLDGSFDPGLGVSGGSKTGLLTVFPQSDGKVMIGGDFTTVNRTARRGIARLFGEAEAINPVVITAEPTGQTVCAGASVTLSVGATGTGPLNYQWRKDSGPINGAIASSYTIPSVASADAGTYDVVVTGAAGPVTSTPAVLAINDPVTVVKHPENWAAIVGDSVTFSVTAGGAGISGYQWRKDGQPISGASGASYKLAAVKAEDEGNYDVVVTGTCGSTTSNPGRLVVSTPGSFRLEAVAPSPTGAVQLNLIGQVGTAYSILSSTNLVQWNLWTNLVAQKATELLLDARTTNPPQIFYRASTP
ncbi:MAG: immunoglobulin domain-containing protein [Verrucomicrobiota bacterium]